MPEDTKLPPDIAKAFYFPVCAPDEIERIFNVQNAKDYLLKLRADTIVDHMRIFRVYRNKKLRDESGWTLESSFSTRHYESFLKSLPAGDRAKLEQVTYGDVFSNEPNGMIFKTAYGPIVTICETLRFFLKFMHLALMDFDELVPDYVRLNAARIGMRVMLNTEALDFYMDPRGILPAAIATKIHEPISDQLEFVAGHEFAHFILGHLSEPKDIILPIFFAFAKDEGAYKPSPIYSYSQKDEFSADEAAIKLLKYTPKQQRRILRAAALWFSCLEIFELACDQINPASQSRIQTHPKASERRERLMSCFKLKGLDYTWIKSIVERTELLKPIISEDISVNFELYEFYGSIYLDRPNTIWRGPHLIDRVDYY